MIVTKDTPKLLFSAKTNGIIWKIKLDDETQQMAFEVRTKDKKVSFYAFDFKKQQLLIDHYSFEENWLLGLDHLQNSTAYFHGFESEFSPVHKGIIAFDLVMQKTIWQNFSIAVHDFLDEGIIVFDPKLFPRKYELINRVNGQKIKAITVEDLNQYKAKQTEIIFPQTQQKENIWESESTLFYKDLNIKSSYVIKDDKINQIIEIYKNNELHFSDILNEDIQKQGADSFMLWSEKLIYIRNKSEILTYLV